MNSSDAARRRAHAHARLLFASLAAALACAAARAQQAPADPNAAYRQIMQHRMEQSERAVEETQRRRFEDGKEHDRFPTDADKSAAKPGTVRAVSPEQRQALAHNEKGLDYFSRNKFEQAVKEYDEAIRLYPTLAPAHNNRGRDRARPNPQSGCPQGDCNPQSLAASAPSSASC